MSAPAAPSAGLGAAFAAPLAFEPPPAGVLGGDVPLTVVVEVSDVVVNFTVVEVASADDGSEEVAFAPGELVWVLEGGFEDACPLAAEFEEFVLLPPVPAGVGGGASFGTTTFGS